MRFTPPEPAPAQPSEGSVRVEVDEAEGEAAQGATASTTGAADTVADGDTTGGRTAPAGPIGVGGGGSLARRAPAGADGPATRGRTAERALSGTPGQVIETEDVGPRVRIFRVGRPSGLSFRAGQYLKVGLPITAPLATVVLLWATLLKLNRDPDDNPSDFRLFSILLVIASVLYIVPQVYGMEAADQEYLGGLPNALISTGNIDLARPILWISLALIAITGGIVFVRFLVRLGQPADDETAGVPDAGVAGADTGAVGGQPVRS